MGPGLKNQVTETHLPQLQTCNEWHSMHLWQLCGRGRVCRKVPGFDRGRDSRVLIRTMKWMSSHVWNLWKVSTVWYKMCHKGYCVSLVTFEIENPSKMRGMWVSSPIYAERSKLASFFFIYKSMNTTFSLVLCFKENIEKIFKTTVSLYFFQTLFQLIQFSYLTTNKRMICSQFIAKEKILII